MNIMDENLPDSQRQLLRSWRVRVHQNLVPDETLPVVGPTRVRVSHLLPEESEISETEWLQAAATNPNLDFLKDTEEDTCTLSDGRPFYDKG